MNYLKEGMIKPVIAKRMPLVEAREAQEFILGAKVKGKIVLTCGEDREATPACVNICPVEARVFGNIKDPNSKVSQTIARNSTLRLRQELGTEPSVYYIMPREGG